MQHEPATPLDRAPDHVAAGRDLWLKREDLHELGAFKWRGASPVFSAYAEQGVEAVVTASTGNHGAAAAWAARRVGLRAIVFVPEQASETKLARIAFLGAELRREGADFDDAKARAAAYAAAHDLPLFDDGAEPAQYDGYRAIGDEIQRQLGRPPATVVVPVGNGALIGGVGEALKPHGTAIIGVVAKEAPVMADSHAAGHVVDSPTGATIADGLAVRVAIPYAVERIQSVVSSMVHVSERAMANAIGSLASAGIRVEASAAAALAGLEQLDAPDEPVVLVLTGRNIDDALFERACAHPELFPE
jgi:threonine dehydratase